MRKTFGPSDTSRAPQFFASCRSSSVKPPFRADGETEGRPAAAIVVCQQTSPRVGDEQATAGDSVDEFLPRDRLRQDHQPAAAGLFAGFDNRFAQFLQFCGPGIDDAPRGDQRNEPIDTQFCGFLDQPRKPVTFGRSDGQRR